MSRQKVPQGRRGATRLPSEDPADLSDDSNTDDFTVIGIPQQPAVERNGKRTADARARANNTIRQRGVSSPWPLGTRILLGLALFLVGVTLVIRAVGGLVPVALIVPTQSQVLGVGSPPHSVTRVPSSSHLLPMVPPPPPSPHTTPQIRRFKVAREGEREAARDEARDEAKEEEREVALSITQSLSTSPSSEQPNPSVTLPTQFSSPQAPPLPPSPSPASPPPSLASPPPSLASLPPSQPSSLPASPPLPPLPPPPFPSPPPPLPSQLSAVCLRSFSATGVFRPPWKGPEELPHPQLWVYLWQGGQIAGKSSVAHNTLEPVSNCTHHAHDYCTRSHWTRVCAHTPAPFTVLYTACRYTPSPTQRLALAGVAGRRAHLYEHL